MGAAIAVGDEPVVGALVARKEHVLGDAVNGLEDKFEGVDDLGGVES